MMLRSHLGSLRRKFLCSVHTRRLPSPGASPVVSFCFDDFPRTAYTAGGSILKSFGARGTYYASLGLMNTANELGDQLRPNDIESLLADGHELGSHTFSHHSARRVSRAVFEQDTLFGREAVWKLAGSAASSFAYPYGHVTAAIKRRLGSHMSSCRGIFGGINQPSDLNLLRANSVYGDVDHYVHAEALLQQLERSGGWLIFYTHDVRRNPSPFGCTPGLLDKVVSMTAEKGFRIAPVGHVVQAARAVAPPRDPAVLPA